MSEPKQPWDDLVATAGEKRRGPVLHAVGADIILALHAAYEDREDQIHEWITKDNQNHSRIAELEAEIARLKD